MNLFTLSLSTAEQGSVDRLLTLLRDQADHVLHMADQAWESSQLLFSKLDDGTISCRANRRKVESDGCEILLRKAVALGIAEYVLHEMEEPIIGEMVHRRYRGTGIEDPSGFRQYCCEILNGKEWEELDRRFRDGDRKRRRNKIAEELQLYLAGHSELHIEGFVTFRLHAYRRELAEIVDYAFDEYMLDRQYQEFISLLKYFVQVQEAKLPHVHVLHKGLHEFTLYDERFEPLEPRPAADRIVAEMMESEMNIEDMVVSSLLAVSPGHITIHTEQPHLQAIRTIQTIFEGRVELCSYCSCCFIPRDESVKQ